MLWGPCRPRAWVLPALNPYYCVNMGRVGVSSQAWSGAGGCSDCTTGFLRFMPSGDVCRLLGFSLGAMLGGLRPAYPHIAQGPRVTPTDDGLPPGASAHRSLGSVLSGQPIVSGWDLGPPHVWVLSMLAEQPWGCREKACCVPCSLRPMTAACAFPGLTRRCSVLAEPSKSGPFWSLTCFWAVCACLLTP